MKTVQTTNVLILFAVAGFAAWIYAGTLPLSEPVFTDAVWIGPAISDGHGVPINAYTAFRKRFVFGDHPTSAVVRVTADSRYLLWVNGAFVERDPARCFPRHQSYDTYDLAPHFQTGTNWLAVLAHHYGMGNAVSVVTRQTGVLAEAPARRPRHAEPASNGY